MAARLLIVEDHEVVRKGVRSLFADNDSFEVCGEAQTGTDAIRMLPELSPDVVILDLGTPGMNGFELAARMRLMSPLTKIVFFSFHETSIPVQLSSIGAFVSKSSPLQELVLTVNRLLHPEGDDLTATPQETRFSEIGAGFNSARTYSNDLISPAESTQQRCQPRSNLSLVVRIRPFDSSLLPEDCTTLNVSRVGLYFETLKDHYVPGANVYVTSDFHSESSMERTVVGVIVRVRKLKDDKWGVAVRICSPLSAKV